MLPIGACVSSPGFMEFWGPSRLFLGIPNARKTVPVCLPLGGMRGVWQAQWHPSLRMARVFLFFHLQRPPLSGWPTIPRQVALTYTATILVPLAPQQAGLPALTPLPNLASD